MSTQLERLRVLLGRVQRRAAEPRGAALLATSELHVLGDDDVVAETPAPAAVIAGAPATAATAALPLAEDSFADLMPPELGSSDVVDEGVPVPPGMSPRANIHADVTAQLRAVTEDDLPPESLLELDERHIVHEPRTDRVDPMLEPVTEAPPAVVELVTAAPPPAFETAPPVFDPAMEASPPALEVASAELAPAMEASPPAFEAEVTTPRPVVEAASDALVLELEPIPVPPSSRRTRPIDELAEPEQPHPPPPESGRHIALPDEFDFEDDLGATGVRAAHRGREAEEEPAAISLAPIAAPQEPVPISLNSLEMELPEQPAPSMLLREVEAPVELELPKVPPPAASEVQMVRPEPVERDALVFDLMPPRPATAPSPALIEVVRAEVAAAEVAAFSGSVAAPFAPSSFGELLDATLAL